MKYFEIITNKEGKVFGITNIKQEIKRIGDEDIITFIANIAGDMKAGKQYLKDMADGIVINIGRFK